MRIWVILNLKDCAARVWFKITSMIARNEVPTPLYYIQFEMTKFSSSDTGLFSLWKCFFYLVASWSSEICKTESFCLFFNFETCKRMIILFLFFLFPFFLGGGGLLDGMAWGWWKVQLTEWIWEINENRKYLGESKTKSKRICSLARISWRWHFA